MNVNETGCTTAGIFGQNTSFEDSEVIFIPAPWDATTSYKDGTSKSPAKIYTASPQLDLFHPDFPELPLHGLHALPIDDAITNENEIARKKAKTVIRHLEQNKEITQDIATLTDDVNLASEKVNQILYNAVEMCIKENKLIGLIGGDHSTSYPLISGLIDYIDTFTILQIDAHMDLRDSYQGFAFSHASIMHNALQNEDISRLVQVGVRDYCEEEHNAVMRSKGRIKSFTNQEIKASLCQGKSWDSLCRKIINNCTDLVYITIDMDGLTPQFCPNTGTPVPGGLDFDQVIYLIKQLSQSKRKIIGFDVVEANGPDHSIDIISATRLSYQLAGYAWLTHQ